MEDQDFGLETDISSHRNEIVTENTIPFDKSFEVYTEIEVSPHNSFKATYKLIAVGKIEQDVEIIARPLSESKVLTELISRALDASNKDTYLNIMYRGNSDVYTEIQPIGYNFLEAEIEVPPHNRMYAIYEVQQPPIVTDVYYPTQDAFTREETAYQTINYGSNSSMVVGRSKDDIWRSFVQFDLSSIHPSYVLKESYLRLYYKGEAPENLKLEILNASSEWYETSLTHLNRPIPIDLIADEFTINRNQGYIEFDVFKIVESWVSLEKNNNGFIIRLSNETASGQTIFYTRETSSPPELIVKYFDSRIFSQGRSQQLTEIFVYKRKHSEWFTEVTVDSIFSFDKLDTEIYAHRPEVPLDFEAQAEITVTKPYVETEIISSIREEDEILIEIGARRPLNREIFAEVTINTPFTLAQINCARIDTSSWDTTVSVTRPSIHAEISVPFHDKNEVFTEIEINDSWTSIVYTELFVAKDKIATEITPRVGKDSNLFAVVHVSKPKIETEIEIKHRNDILVEIEPNIKSDVFTEIIVSKPSIGVSIAVQLYEKSEKDTEIFVKFVQDIFSELTVKAVSQVDTVIDIKKVSQVYTEISVNRRFVQTEITIPTWADQEVPTIIEPRILMVNNKLTIITVNGSVSGYAFIL
ncbi:DNRLRE domain-containing protein [Lysinibacillus sp. FSL R5-0849]|uniref:DNRLRE domain-containing protein n=1 Tax=Lysinibacillus sp. FSL R5-0849 TaxID=2921660 RepID=UPI00315A5D72